jgi:peptidoglycan/xylan/chitin deacetylase (PgdA/CDA1 family)
MDRMIADSGQSLEQLAKGLWMDAACLRHLHEENHVIGLHSHSHPTRIEYLHPEAQFREYRENYVRLKEVTGESPRTVSHPCNSYNESTLTILRRLGVTAGFRANMELDDLSELEYPRQDHANVLREMQLCASPS